MSTYIYPYSQTYKRILPMFYQKIIVLVSVFWIEAVSGLKCLSCQDITHPQLCRQIVTCTPGEFCGIEKFISRGGDVRYSLDCVANEICSHPGSNITERTVHNTENIRLCTQCCHGDLCNSGGCGESDFQELGLTVCYQCQYKLINEECTKIEACSSDETCYIEETALLTQSYFTSGCRRKALCDAIKNPGTAVGRRKRDDLCVQCCGSFLCNKECGNDKCIDKPECVSLISHYNVCGDNQTASEICPLSCGLCQSAATTASSICKDVSQNCEYLESKFRICQDSPTVDDLGCHKTCGFCGNASSSTGATTSTAKPVTQSTITTTASTTTTHKQVISCNYPWVQYEHYCFYIGDEMLSWMNASDQCRHMHAELATLNTQGRNDYIASKTNHSVYYWVGGNDLSKEGTWKWKETNENIGPYVNWYPNDPDGGTGQNCMAFNYGHTQKWIDAPCPDRQQFICGKQV